MLCYPLYTGITGTCKVTNAPTCAVLHHDHCRVRPSKLSWPRPGPRRSGWLLRNFGKSQSHVHIAAAVAEPHWCLPSSPWMNRMNFEPSTVCIGFVCEKKVGLSENGGTPKWMVYTGKFYSMDDLGGPNFRKPPCLLRPLLTSPETPCFS